jgi:hypothetical protein
MIKQADTAAVQISKKINFYELVFPPIEPTTSVLRTTGQS